MNGGNIGYATGENKQALGKVRDFGTRWIGETVGEEGTATLPEAAPVQVSGGAGKRKWGNDEDLVGHAVGVRERGLLIAKAELEIYCYSGAVPARPVG